MVGLEAHLIIALLLTICGLALLKGGVSERWTAAVLLGNQTVESSAYLLLRLSHDAVPILTLVLDGVVALALLVLAMKFVKIWLGIAMLLQSVLLGLHGAVMADFGLPYSTYSIANNVTLTVLLVLLLGATLIAWRERGRDRQAPPGRTSAPAGQPARA